jgi:hypothetical protein
MTKRAEGKIRYFPFFAAEAIVDARQYHGPYCRQHFGETRLINPSI